MSLKITKNGNEVSISGSIETPEDFDLLSTEDLFHFVFGLITQKIPKEHFESFSRYVCGIVLHEFLGGSKNEQEKRGKKIWLVSRIAYAIEHYVEHRIKK